MTTPATIQLLGRTTARRSNGGNITYAQARFPLAAQVSGASECWMYALTTHGLFDSHSLSGGAFPSMFTSSGFDNPQQAAAACDARARELIAEIEWYREA